MDKRVIMLMLHISLGNLVVVCIQQSVAIITIIMMLGLIAFGYEMNYIPILLDDALATDFGGMMMQWSAGKVMGDGASIITSKNQSGENGYVTIAHRVFPVVELVVVVLKAPLATLNRLKAPFATLTIKHHINAQGT